MRSKWMKYVGALLLLFIAGGFIFTKPCFAASAEVDITSDSGQVTQGNNFYVNITINSDTTFGDFEANLTYDENVMEYVGGPSVITGNNGFLKISDTNVANGDTSRKYTLKFKALTVGTSDVSFSGPVMVNDFDTFDAMSVSSNVLTVDVKAPKTASSNAKLKSLKISPSELSPAFDKNKHEYSTKVNYDTEHLVIDAATEDSKATVSISGNDFLKEGENKVIIKVLAESGAVIEYTINVTRDAAPKDAAATDNTAAANDQPNNFQAVRINGDVYAIYSGKYQLIEPGSDVEIPNGYVKSKTILSDISVTVYYPESNPDSDFLLIYAKNDAGEEGFYQYDRVEKTLQRFDPQEITVTQANPTPTSIQTAQQNEYRSNIGKAAVIIALLSVFCALLIVLSIRLYMKLRGFKDDDLD